MRSFNRFWDTARRLLCAAALFCAAGAQAQFTLLSPADLKVSMTAAPSPVPAQDLFTYTVTVQNPALTRLRCVRDPLSGRFVCSEMVTSADASAVSLVVSLGAGVNLISPSADSGFMCSGGNIVTCSNGSIPAGGTATIRLTARAPASAGSVTASATASSPYADRDLSNNNVALTTAVGPPNPNKPDLWANGTATPNPFKAWEVVRFDVFIHNSGPAPASNVSFRFYTNLPAGLAALSVNSGFSCRGLSGFGQALEVECTGGNIAGWSSGFLSVQVKLANSLTPAGTPLTLYGYLDSAQTNDELNENNNSFTLVSIVSP